jgi:hypothetical protein
MRSIKIIALVCALALGAAACGAGNDDAAHNRRWAKRFCTSLATWQTSTTSSSAALQEYLKTPNLDTSAAKTRLAQYLQDATTATDTLARKLGTIGTPAIPAKHKAVATLQTGSAAVKSSIADAKTAVDALPVDNGDQFRLGIQTANSTLRKGFAAFGDALDRVNRLDADGKLIKAERSVAQCRPLLS